MNDRRRLLRGVMVLGSAPWGAPAKPAMLEPARVLTGFPPGGTVDAVARLLARCLQGTHAPTVTVENRTGAGGRLAVAELLRSPPDGRTLMVAPTAIVTLYPHLVPQLGYALDDVAPVCGAATTAFALAVGPLVPAEVRTLASFLEWARRRPGSATYGTAGTGLPPHLLGALLDKEAGVPLTHVPYRGTLPALVDTLGGQVAAVIGPLGDFVSHARADRLRVLATSGATRSRFLPSAPTFAEQGFKAHVLVEGYAVFLPGRATQDLLSELADAVLAALALPGVEDSWAPHAVELSPTRTALLAKQLRQEHAAWAAWVRRLGFRPES